MGRSLLIAIPLMLFLAAVQSAVFTRVPLFGQVIQPLLLMAIAWGLLRGTAEGTAWGFVAGLALSLFSVGPAGAGSLSLIAVVALAVAARALLPQSRYLLPMVLGGVGSALFLLLNGVLAQMAGFIIDFSFIRELPLFMLVQAAVMVVVYWPLYALDQLLNPTPISTID